MLCVATRSSVATMSSLAQLRVWDGYYVDVMTWGWLRAETPEPSSYLWCLQLQRVADQQRMATRRALEWIRVLEARLVFRYELSDLFLMSFPTPLSHQVLQGKEQPMERSLPLPLRLSEEELATLRVQNRTMSSLNHSRLQSFDDNPKSHLFHCNKCKGKVLNV